MIENLDLFLQRYNEIADLIIQPKVISDHKKYSGLLKEYKDLELKISKLKGYQILLNDFDEAKSIIRNEVDSELIEMAQSELDRLERMKPELEKELKMLLIPKDPEDKKNVMIEIRAGTGGDEASLFAGDLYRMCTRYLQSSGT